MTALRAPFSTETPPAILPLLSGEGDQRLVREWISNHDRYTLVDPEASLESVSFDCCLLDGESLKANADVLQRRRRESDPLLLPCLLLLPEADISVLEADDGEIADGVIFDAVDEIVSMPIKKVELEWRTKALLRLRSQSLELERKQQQLRQFKRATEAAGHAVYITDIDGRIEYVNPAFEAMTGYDASEVLGETPKILDASEMSGSYFERLWDTISSGGVWEEDLINERQNGEQYHAHQTIAPVLDESDTPVKFVAIQSDITQRVEGEQRLEMFRDIVERLDDPLMIQDRDGTFRLVNEALTEFAGLTKEELIGKTEYAFMDEESATRIEAHKQQVLDQERPVQYSISPTFPTDKDAIFSTVRYPYYGREDRVEGTIAICRNVTELHAREDQLAVIDRILRHNLRNNMTTIGMFAEKLEEGLSGELESDARRIQATSQDVNQMVEKQRKITKFLSSNIERQTLDFVHIAKTVGEQVAETYPEADISYDLPEACDGYATRVIEDAVAEVIENAIIHADTASPSVRVRATCAEENCTIAVADEGPGIPEMDREVLENGSVLGPLEHGSGIGLWLVNLLVAHSDGTVTVTESDPEGSVVRLQFPR